MVEILSNDSVLIVRRMSVDELKEIYGKEICESEINELNQMSAEEIKTFVYGDFPPEKGENEE